MDSLVRFSEINQAKTFEFNLTLSKEQNLQLIKRLDLLSLKKVSSDESVYLAENIGIAINNTVWGSDTQVDPPQSISQILLQSNDEAEENWDA